jgi:hypothetical protein
MLRQRSPLHSAKALVLGWAVLARSWFERKHALTFQRIRNILLEMHAEKRASLSFDMTGLASPKETLLTFDQEERFVGALREEDTLLRVFGAERFVFMEESADMQAATAFFHILRNGRIKKQIFLLLAALRGQVDLYFVETGFVSRISNVRDASIPLVYRRSCSWIVDDMAFYYDALLPSRIERFLNSPERALTPPETERAEKIIRLLREHKITKYNYQPLHTPKALQRPGKKVLVADQSLRDASIPEAWRTKKRSRPCWKPRWPRIGMRWSSSKCTRIPSAGSAAAITAK